MSRLTKPAAARLLAWTLGIASVVYLGVLVAHGQGWLRDEDGFREDGYGLGGWSDSRYPGGAAQDMAWARRHPAAMMAAGDAACEWLQTRPEAPDDGDPRKWGAGPLVTRYLKSEPETLDLPLHKFSRTFLVYQAFNHLCAGAYNDKVSDVDPDGDDVRSGGD